MKTIARVSVLVSLGLLCCASAASAGQVLGFSYARSCYEAAERAAAGTALQRKALRACDEALDDESLPVTERVATLVNRGIVQMHSRRLEAAIADYDEAIRLRPDSAEAYVNKGIALIHQGDRDREAVAALSEGIDRGPARPEVAYYSRGMANEGLGRTRDAYEDYNRAVQLAPDWPEPAQELQRFRIVKRKTAGV